MGASLSFQWARDILYRYTIGMEVLLSMIKAGSHVWEWGLLWVLFLSCFFLLGTNECFWRRFAVWSQERRGH